MSNVRPGRILFVRDKEVGMINLLKLLLGLIKLIESDLIYLHIDLQRMVAANDGMWRMVL